MKIFIGLLIILFPSTLFATVISLEEAIHANIVKVIVTGKPIENNPENETHTGKCLRIQLRNTGGKASQLNINSAYRFSNEKNAHQDLMTTESVLVSLLPNQLKTISINALCCEMHNASPSDHDTFQLAREEMGSLKKLCNLLERQKNFGNTAQQAMWCLTDDSPVENIYDTHPDIKMEDELVALIATEKGLSLIPPRKKAAAAVRILRYAIEAEGAYTQWVDKPTTVGIYITDSLNNPLITLMKDERETRINGTLKYSYGYRGQLPKGTYFLQAKIDGVWKKEKEIVVGRN